MPTIHPLELRLQKMIVDCPQCVASAVTCERGERFGIVVRHRGYPVGVWSVMGERLCFRNIAVWEVLHALSDAPAAHAATLAMARSNYWGA